MPDLHDELDRLADRIDREVDLDDVRARRERRERRRVRQALVVGLCVAVAGTLVAVATLRDEPTVPPPASTGTYEPPSVPYLWPENWARVGEETPGDVQAQADTGSADVAWRLDPEEVAIRFAQMVFGWSEAGLTPRDLGPGVPGHVYELHSCTTESGCPMDHQQYVWVQQPVLDGDGGIWSVAGTWADTLSVGVGGMLTDTTEVVPAGATLHMELDVPDDQKVVVGYAGSSDCSGFAGTGLQGLDPSLAGGEYAMDLPSPVPPDDPSVSCGTEAAAFAFAYTVPAVNTPTGDPFLESGDLFAVTAMPFVFDQVVQRESSAPVSHEPAKSITIRCDDTSISLVDTDTVIASPSGVSVHVENATSDDLSISFDTAGGGEGAPPGESFRYVQTPPGQETATCSTASRTIGAVSFTVVDPNSYYVPTDLGCGSSMSGSAIDYAPGAEGYPKLFDAVRATGDVEPTDELVRAGYPMSEPTADVLVLRDGEPIHLVSLSFDDSGWLAHSVESCG